MTVRLRGFGAFSRYLGDEPSKVRLPEGASLQDLLRWVDKRWGAEIPERLWKHEAGGPHPSVMVMLDGKRAAGFAEVLSDNQEVHLLGLSVGG